METEGNIFNPEVIIEGYDLIISKQSKANKSSKSKLDLIKNELQRKKFKFWCFDSNFFLLKWMPKVWRVLFALSFKLMLFFSSKKWTFVVFSDTKSKIYFEIPSYHLPQLKKYGQNNARFGEAQCST